MHDEFSDEENQQHIVGESNFDFYDHELDNMELTKDEIRKMNDNKFTYDFSRYPRHFKTVHEALDTYCSLGYPNKAQFRLYEHKSAESKSKAIDGASQQQCGKTVFFSLSCYMRNMPRYDSKYYTYDQQNGRMPKVSNCNVNVRFFWNEREACFERKECFKYVHDHRLEIDERCLLPSNLLHDIKLLVMDNIDIPVSEVIQKIYHKHGKRLRHIDVLNALKLIKGDVKLDVALLMADLDQVKDKYPETQITLNTGTPVVVFFQTKDMLETYRLYREVMLITVSKKRKNKYGLFQIHMTGVNNFGRAIVFATGFTNIKCKEAYQWIFQEFSKRCLNNSVDLPTVIVTSLEQDVLDAKADVFSSSLHLVSQYYLLLAAKEALGPYKKRMDFDFMQVQDRFERIVLE